MEQYLPIIIQLISGAVGGNVAGALLKDKNLGTLGNSIAGILGGVGAAQGLSAAGVLPQLAAAVGGGQVGDIVASLVSGGIGGAVLMAIVGLLRPKKTA
jgi:uncharacterized membrane protein YeaQ/YmgE (transglycosylase-associated protein family)